MWNFKNDFKPLYGAGALFCGIILSGVTTGCFNGVFNNYLADIRHFSEFDRGFLEFFREIPGLILVFVLALMHRMSEWKIVRIGTLVGMAGIAGLFFTGGDKLCLTAVIMVWSAGEHIMMPVRNAIAMQMAKPGKTGKVLGLSSSSGYLGQIFGGLLVALIFRYGPGLFPDAGPLPLYYTVWMLILFFLICIFFCSFPKHDSGAHIQRPRLYFHVKYKKYYILELFYGARKQIFLTFAPFVLILVYGVKTEEMAILIGCCAAVNIFCGSFIGKLTDYFGYRNIMIYDTVILFFVCMIYGFADQLFPKPIALWVVMINYVLDAVISTASMASNIYVREISNSPGEITATLTTGVSINHLISVSAALLGGLLWQSFGVGVLFGFAGLMGLLNTAYAVTLPKPSARIIS